MSRHTSPGPFNPHSHNQSFQPNLPSRQKSKVYATGIAAGAEDLKYHAKYKELKRKVKEIEGDNDKLHFKVLQARKNIQRTKFERSILYDNLSAMTPPQEAPDRQGMPPIHARSGPSMPMPHPHSHNYQLRDSREHPSLADPNDPAFIEYMRMHPNVRTVPGQDGRPIPVSEMPMGPGMAPSAHGMPSLHASRRGSGGSLDSSRQLPPLPPLPSVSVQHFEPSRVHGHPHAQPQPHPHPLSDAHMHAHPGSSLDHARSASSSRSRSYLGSSQVYLPSHPYQPDGFPPVQRVLHSPSIPGDRERSRRHDVPELAGSHVDHMHSRHPEALVQHPSHGPSAETRSSARIHSHQRGTYITRGDEFHDRELDKEREREREWDRSHEGAREYTSARNHTPPLTHRSRSALDRRSEYPDQSHSREHDAAGHTMYSRSGTPVSGSGSGSGHGTGDNNGNLHQPDPRSFYEHDRGRYALRPVNAPEQQHEDMDSHEDSRPLQPPDWSKGGTTGSSLHEHRRPSLEPSRKKRSRGDVEEGEGDLAEVSRPRNMEGLYSQEEMGSKRFHPDSSANPGDDRDEES